MSSMDIVDKLNGGEVLNINTCREAATEIESLRAQLAEAKGKIAKMREGVYENACAECGTQFLGGKYDANCGCMGIAAQGVEVFAWMRQCEVNYPNLARIFGTKTDAHRIPLYLSPPAAKVPEGYALVPVEPTQAMLDEARYSRECPISGKDDSASIYKAMLLSAQEGEK